MKKKCFIALMLTSTLALSACTFNFTNNVNDPSDKDNPSQNFAQVTPEEESNDPNPVLELPGNNDVNDPATNKPDEPEAIEEIDIDWKSIYADFLNNEMDDIVGDDWQGYFVDYGLIYVNNDNVPELVLGGDCEATGNIVCTIVDGEVYSYHLSRLSFFYKEYSNYLDNAEGHMGYYFDDILSIGEMGFETVFTGTYQEELDEDYNYLGMVYEIGMQEVTEEEYEKAVDSYIPRDERMYWSKGCRLQDMLDYLEGNTASDYKEAYSKEIEAGISLGYGDTAKYYSLVERDGADPMLLVVGDSSFRILAFEDGLLFYGPDWYVSEMASTSIIGKTGIVENFYNFGEGADFGRYYIKNGTLTHNYGYAGRAYDDDGIEILDEYGNAVWNYTINGIKVTEQEFTEEFISKYGNEKYISIVTAGYDSDMERFEKSEILDILNN